MKWGQAMPKDNPTLFDPEPDDEDDPTISDSESVEADESTQSTLFESDPDDEVDELEELLISHLINRTDLEKKQAADVARALLDGFPGVKIEFAPTQEIIVPPDIAADLERAHSECQACIDQIRRELGPEPEGVTLAIVTNMRDYGPPLIVHLDFDFKNQQATDYAQRVIFAAPKQWNEESSPETGE